MDSVDRSSRTPQFLEPWLETELTNTCHFAPSLINKINLILNRELKNAVTPITAFRWDPDKQILRFGFQKKVPISRRRFDIHDTTITMYPSLKPESILTAVQWVKLN